MARLPSNRASAAVSQTIQAWESAAELGSHPTYSNRRHSVIDGPFAETKELLAAPQPARRVGRYASVNGLEMYYEMHGRGRPLVLMHSALSTIDSAFGGIVRALASTRRVIAIEQQAHGRTADVDRTLTYQQMADDTAELLRQLQIEQADFFGFSMGAAAALEVAVRHPDVVRKLAVLSGAYNQGGLKHASMDKLYQLAPDDPMLSGFAQEFARVGAAPDRFTRAYRRIREAFSASSQLSPSDLRAIRAETLVMSGEDGLVYPEHIKDMSRLVRRARLHLFSGDDHHPSIVGRSAALLPSFLDTPLS